MSRCGTARRVKRGAWRNFSANANAPNGSPLGTDPAAGSPGTDTPPRVQDLVLLLKQPVPARQVLDLLGRHLGHAGPVPVLDVRLMHSVTQAPLGDPEVLCTTGARRRGG